MPIFEYQCNTCDTDFEKLIKSSNQDPIVCVNCKSDDVTKKISTASFALKGTGWYKTDFKGPN